MWMILGNAVADILAGSAASRVQVSAEERVRAEQWEQRVLLVRLRLLRATLDSLAAEKRLEPPGRKQ
eukprot:2408130-Pyramimonas_sp.AAC.1